jgi:hypothetical protein
VEEALDWMMMVMAAAKMTQLDPPFIRNKSSKLNISFLFCSFIEGEGEGDNWHHASVKILRYQETLDRKSNVKTLHF